MHRVIVKGVSALVAPSLQGLRGMAAGALVAAMGLSQPILADHVSGSEGWGWFGQHQCLYISNGSSWVPTSICAVPDSNSQGVWHKYNFYGNGQIEYRVDGRDPNWFVVQFPDVGSGPAFWSVPNRGSIANMFSVEPEVLFLWWAEGQRWVSLAEIAASAKVQSTATSSPTAGGMVLGQNDPFASAIGGYRTGVITIGGGGNCLSPTDFMVAATAVQAAGQPFPARC
jgi:hypothetical protein